MKIQFEKHHGIMNTSNGTVTFYNLVFLNIIHASNFFRHLDPGNYDGWVKDDLFGIVDLDTGWIYSNSDWHPPNNLILDIYGTTKKPDAI